MLDDDIIEAFRVKAEDTGAGYQTLVNAAFRGALAAANAREKPLTEKAAEHPDTQTVLLATRSIEALRRAFQNYFLDRKQFLGALAWVERLNT